jgi:hypothetical protein
LISGGLDWCRVIVKCSFPFTPFTHFIFLLASAFSGYRLSLSFLSLLAWFFGTQGRITRVLTACIAPRTLGLESSDPFPTTPNTAYSNRAGHLMSWLVAPDFFLLVIHLALSLVTVLVLSDSRAAYKRYYSRPLWSSCAGSQVRDQNFCWCPSVEEHQPVTSPVFLYFTSERAFFSFLFWCFNTNIFPESRTLAVPQEKDTDTLLWYDDSPLWTKPCWQLMTCTIMRKIWAHVFFGLFVVSTLG